MISALLVAQVCWGCSRHCLDLNHWRSLLKLSRFAQTHSPIKSHCGGSPTDVVVQALVAESSIMLSSEIGEARHVALSHLHFVRRQSHREANAYRYR